MISRRRWLAVAASGALLGWVRRPALGALLPESASPLVVVYKDASCGCCKAWVKHMAAAGFPTEAHDVADMDAIKTRYGVPTGMRSCHTAIVGAYAIEGHVPADDVKRLLHEQPKVRGLAVPGMVTGSPGMEGGTPERYLVLAFQSDGKNLPFASH